MEWKRATTKEGAVVLPDTWLHLHYYEALNALFRIENMLRVFAYSVLKKELHGEWQLCNFQDDEGHQESIKSVAKRRRAQTANFGYLCYNVSCPLMYLTSGELIRLMMSDAYWKHFAPHFRGAKEVIRNKLDEIGAIRNSLAHFRPISPDDVDVIKQNAKHVLMGVETMTAGLLGENHVVPTNTTEDWYSVLKTLGTDLCALRFTQSKDGDWIRVLLTYTPPELSKRQYGENYVNFHVMTIMTASVLRKYTELTKLVEFVTENTPHIWGASGPDATITKSIRFTFSRGNLSASHGIVKDALADLLATISKETELITTDNMAKGELVTSVMCSASRRKTEDATYWQYGISAMGQPVCPDDPEEYWGDFESLNDDFIAATHVYPWMPVAVSKPDIGF